MRGGINLLHPLSISPIVNVNTPPALKEISWDEAIELGSSYPYVLAVTLDKRGKANIIGLGWWTFVSWEPAMIAISIGKDCYSHECIEYCKEFVLCFPSLEQSRGAWLRGKKSGRDIDKFQRAGFTPVSSQKVKPPLISGSTVAYECRVTDSIETGDHTLYVGEVMAVHGTPGRKSNLYIAGREIMVLPTSMDVDAVIIGPTTISATAVDGGVGVERMELYIDGELRRTSYGDQVEFVWNQRTFLNHTLEVVTVDFFGHRSSEILKLWVFNL